MVMAMMVMLVVTMKEDSDAKNGDRDDVDDNDNIDFEVDDGVKCKFAQVIFGAFAQYLMWIFYFLVQFNFCSIRMPPVTGFYEPGYDLGVSSTCWFLLNRIFLGNYLPSNIFFFD